MSTSVAQTVRAWLAGQPRTRGIAQGMAGQFRKNLRYYFVGTLIVILCEALMASRDFLVKASVDAVGAGDLRAMRVYAAWMVGASLTTMFGRLSLRVTMYAAGLNAESELRSAMLEHLHRLGQSFFRRMATGEIMSRMNNDLITVRYLLGPMPLNTVSGCLALVSALFVMIVTSWKLALATLATFPAMAMVMGAFWPRLFASSRANQQDLAKLSNRVLASLSGVRVVRSFAMEQSELAAFDRQNKKYLEKNLRLALLRGWIGPITGALTAASVLIVFWYGGSLLVSDPMFTTGGFVAFWLAFFRLTRPMLLVGQLMGLAQQGRAASARMQEVFDAVPDVKDGTSAAPAEIRGAIRVEDLSFEYDGRQMLERVSFEVPAGSSLAIVGRTGSGKSTLASLLPRLLPNDPGTVFLDGVDVCDLPLKTVRAAIGYARQDAFLFSTTVAHNVAYALDDPDAAHDLVVAAVREAQVLDEIRLLPEGFDTVVGERGIQLSGGQKQRVALARALVHQPKVLVLDDPLSAVDARTEAAILGAIERQKAQRTVILITHRVAAAQRCDRVMVLERGRIVEQGTHDALLAQGGLYALFAVEQQLEHEVQAIGMQTLEGAPGAGG